MALTKKQREIFDFLKIFIESKGYSPSIREIQDEFGLSSPATVHKHLSLLEQKSYIRKDANKNRSIDIVDASEVRQVQNIFALETSIQIPLRGMIQAGSPIEVFEDNEQVDVPQYMVKKPSKTYALKVRGDSMVDACISSGDTILIEERSWANNGEIVVASVEGELTLKSYFKEKDHIRLQPENTTMEAILVYGEVSILGVLTGLLRSY
ncbi:MAG: repressor LexA [Candidatus Cloacimonadota bacterium]|nr:MAG: repressor LexA [Candidatus Cloacimonadota bacterium]PCJ21013.1 MAG: repressor LexA [Candidatus Cloacimonadota bacterium]